MKINFKSLVTTTYVSIYCSGIDVYNFFIITGGLDLTFKK